MAEQGHKPDEYVSEEQLVACSLMLGKVANEVLFGL
jgi:acetylornithine deacetylase/succinyl-diaminopimelate desuccinylase-like protein